MRAILQLEGYQSYVVLSMGRILYTLQHGTVVSKVTSTNWAKDTLPERWRPLIERAWIKRSAVQGQTPPQEIDATLDFLRWVLNRVSSLTTNDM